MAVLSTLVATPMDGSGCVLSATRSSSHRQIESGSKIKFKCRGHEYPPQRAKEKVMAQFATWPKDLLCVLCESLAFFAVKFFFTAKLVRSAGEPRWSGRPRPPTLFADVLTAKNPILIRGKDECSTTLSFRIRFSGAEAATSICHSESDPSSLKILIHIIREISSYSANCL